MAEYVCQEIHKEDYIIPFGLFVSLFLFVCLFVWSFTPISIQQVFFGIPRRFVHLTGFPLLTNVCVSDLPLIQQDVRVK